MAPEVYFILEELVQETVLAKKKIIKEC